MVNRLCWLLLQCNSCASHRGKTRMESRCWGDNTLQFSCPFPSLLTAGVVTSCPGIIKLYTLDCAEGWLQMHLCSLTTESPSWRKALGLHLWTGSCLIYTSSQLLTVTEKLSFQEHPASTSPPKETDSFAAVVLFPRRVPLCLYSFWPSPQLVLLW